MVRAFSLALARVGQLFSTALVAGVDVDAGQVEELLLTRCPVMYAANKPVPEGDGSNPVYTAKTPLAPRSSSSPSGRVPSVWSTHPGAVFKDPLHVDVRLVQISFPNCSSESSRHAHT
jgi:hypothetical protein